MADNSQTTKKGWPFPGSLAPDEKKPASDKDSPAETELVHEKLAQDKKETEALDSAANSGKVKPSM